MFGLPACTTANGCFTEVNQTGGSPLPTPDAGWDGETSLDLDMVSALCPLCHIVLVEANSNSDSDLGTAVNEAVSLGAKVVDNSYGQPRVPGRDERRHQLLRPSRRRPDGGGRRTAASASSSPPPPLT